MEREYRVGNQLKIESTSHGKLVKNEFVDRVMDNVSAPIKKGPSPPEGSDKKMANDMYDVEQIVGSRHKNGRWEYRIRWKGYGRAEDTWEPKENLGQCLEMIEEFQRNKKVQGKKLKTKRGKGICKSQTRMVTSNINEDTSLENATNSLPSTDAKAESQPDTFWKDFSEGNIQIIRDEDMYSHVKGRRAKRNANAQDSKTPSSHSSTSNDSSESLDRLSSEREQTNFNLGVLQTLSHFFDNSLQSIERLRKPQKDRLYRSRSKLSRGKKLTKKSSIVRVERVSCSTGKLMLKIKGHKLPSCSYSKTSPNLLGRKPCNLRSSREKISSSETKVPVQIAAKSPPKRNLLDELFTAVVDGKSVLVEELYKLYSIDIDHLTLTSVANQLLRDALASNNWKIMEVLIRNGADINNQATDGSTILMAACQNSNFEVVQKLLDLGAYKDKQNSQGMTALMIACNVGDYNSVVKLLNSGANFVLVNSQGLSSVRLANQSKHHKITNLLTTHVQRVKACFETEVRTSLISAADVMYALFPLHCYSLNEQSEITIAFDYKELDPNSNSVSGNGYIIFIAKATISEREVSCKLDGADGNSLVTWVTLNNKKQEPISVGYSCNPLHEGRNVLTIFTEKSNRDNVKLIICAYKVRLDTTS